ncbi:Hypothetical protein D9617_4g001180 [Elsinoe fawcettii]|nr:Hypothetical protein D9617_4g001180 [Elsinoe fawcettii]
MDAGPARARPRQDNVLEPADETLPAGRRYNLRPRPSQHPAPPPPRKPATAKVTKLRAPAKKAETIVNEQDPNRRDQAEIEGKEGDHLEPADDEDKESLNEGKLKDSCKVEDLLHGSNEGRGGAGFIVVIRALGFEKPRFFRGAAGRNGQPGQPSRQRLLIMYIAEAL